MLLTILRYTFILLLISGGLNAQYFDWVAEAGGTQDDRGYAIHTLENGNSVITGSFRNTVNFGSHSLTPGGGLTLFIAMYDSLGNALWAISSTGSGNIEGKGITRDLSGNVIVTGFFNGSITIGTTTLSSAGNDDVFLAKFSPTGTFLWAVRGGSSTVDQGYAVTADSADNIYITGYCSGSSNFGGILISASFYDAFLVKYNSAGVSLWARKGGGSSTDYGSGVCIDPYGYVFMTGYIYGATSAFDAINVNGAGAYDAFVAKYDSSGTVLWVRTGGGNLNDRANAVAADPFGNIYITGFFSVNASFSSVNLTGLGEQDVYIAKYNATGDLLWIRQAGGQLSYNIGYGIVTDKKGLPYLTGTFQNVIHFSPLSMQSLGMDPFIAKYDTSGNPIWIQRAGAGQDDEGRGISVDTSGHVYITGWCRGNPVPFGVHNLNGLGSDDVYIARTDSGVITLNPTPLIYCAGDTILIPFLAHGNFQSGNQFTAELSDANGNFMMPVTLGVFSGNVSAMMSGVIPQGTPPGTAYRVRINGSFQAAQGRISTQNLTIKSLPPAPTPFSNTPVCTGADIELSAPSITGAVWNWQGPNGFSSNLQGPVITGAGTIQSGVYSVWVVVNGCTGPYATEPVVITNVPVNIIAGNNSPVCSGQTLLLTAQTYSGVLYRWDGPSGFSSSLQNPVIPNVQQNQQGFYSVYVYAGTCSSIASVMNVVIDPTPGGSTASAIQNPICTMQDLQLNAGLVSGASYYWSGPDGFTSSQQNPLLLSVNTNAAGIYSLIAHIAQCSSSVSTVNISVNTSPSAVSISSNSPVCEGFSINLQAGTIPSGSYVWGGPNGFTSDQQNPVLNGVSTNASGVYTLVIDNGCPSVPQSISIVVNGLPPSAQATDDSPVCVGASLSLKASTVPNATYYWEGINGFSSTQQNPIINPVNISDAGAYSVYAIVAGCTSQVSITTAIVNTPLANPLISSGSPYCEGDIITLSVNSVPGALYYWAGPGGWVSAQQNPVIQPATNNDAGTYSCFVTSGGCTSGTSTHVITVNPVPPAPQITFSNDTFWSNSPVGNQWYEFTSGSIAGANNDWFVPQQSGVYYVVISLNGCSSPASDTLSYLATYVSGLLQDELFQIYPNPGNGTFRIMGGHALQGILKVQLWDVQGKLCDEFEYKAGQALSVILSEQYGTGVYGLKIFNGSRLHYSGRIIVHRE